MNDYQNFSDKDLINRIEELENMLDESKRKLEDQNSMLDVLETSDELTKLLNRRTVYTHLEEEINRARRYKAPLSILLLDVDHFDEIATKYGDTESETALKKVAAAVKYQIRKVDIAGRFAEEEVLVVFPNTGADDANIISERLRKSVGELAFESDLRITVSGGLNVYQGQDIIDFLETTDQALNQARKLGGDRIELFDPS